MSHNTRENLDTLQTEIIWCLCYMFCIIVFTETGIMTFDIFSGFPVLPTAQADQGHHHDGERGHGRCLPRLLREPQEPVYGGEFTYTCTHVCTL